MDRNMIIKDLNLLLKALHQVDEWRIKEIKTKERLDWILTAEYWGNDKHIELMRMIENSPTSLTTGAVLINLFVDILVGGICTLIGYVAVFLLKGIINIFFNSSFQLTSTSTLVIAIIFGILVASVIFWLTITELKNDDRSNAEHLINMFEEHNKRYDEEKNNIEFIKADYANAKKNYDLWINNANAVRTRLGIGSRYDMYNIQGILSILEDGRADTLKEALNIYENEYHQIQLELDESRDRMRQEKLAEQQLQVLSNINAESTRAANAAEEASRKADDAAYWSAVSAYFNSKK